MHFVDEQDALRDLDLVDDALEALFELAAVNGARDQRANVEHQHALVQQIFRNVAVDDALGQAFDDGRLADAGLADQRRIVLAPARENLNDALDLVAAPDDRVELAFGRLRGHIGAQLIDQWGVAALLVAFRLFSRHNRSFLHLLKRQVPQLLKIDPQRLQHIGRDAIAFPYQTEQQVLGTNVMMSHPARFIHRQLDDALGARGQADAAKLASLALAHHFFDDFACFLKVHPQVVQHLGRDSGLLADQPEQQVLGADVAVVHELRFFLRVGEDLSSLLRKPIKFVGHYDL